MMWKKWHALISALNATFIRVSGPRPPRLTPISVATNTGKQKQEIQRKEQSQAQHSRTTLQTLNAVLQSPKSIQETHGNHPF